MKTKYPRTPHLPWSPGMTSDDRVIKAEALARLGTMPTVVTEKMDGGNVTLMRDTMYCRSLDSGTPPWEVRAKSEWARVAHDIPEGWRVSCESMWARRSVNYDELPGPLLVIGVWDTENLLSWTDTLAWSELLGIPTVPVLGESVGVHAAASMWSAVRDVECSKGYVVRSSNSVPVREFGSNIAKWVRAGHVRTDSSWRHRDDFAVNMFR